MLDLEVNGVEITVKHSTNWYSFCRYITCMKLLLKRYSSSDQSTLGLLFIDGVFSCYTLEDPYREKKVHGATRIPEGTYKILFRKTLSPKTIDYRDRFPWFTWHLELLDVDGFQYIYIHIGNTIEDTDGCILVGSKANNNKMEDGFISDSAIAFSKIYNIISEVLYAGEEVEIEIQNIE